MQVSTLVLEWSDLFGHLYVIILLDCLDVSHMLKVFLLVLFQVQFTCLLSVYL